MDSYVESGYWEIGYAEGDFIPASGENPIRSQYFYKLPSVSLESALERAEAYMRIHNFKYGTLNDGKELYKLWIDDDDVFHTLGTDIEQKIKNADISSKLSDYLTKANASEIYETKSNASATYATKAELQTGLENVDISEELQNYYTKNDIDTTLTNYYTKDEFATEVADPMKQEIKGWVVTDLIVGGSYAVILTEIENQFNKQSTIDSIIGSILDMIDLPTIQQAVIDGIDVGAIESTIQSNIEATLSTATVEQAIIDSIDIPTIVTTVTDELQGELNNNLIIDELYTRLNSEALRIALRDELATNLSTNQTFIDSVRQNLEAKMLKVNGVDIANAILSAIGQETFVNAVATMAVGNLVTNDIANAMLDSVVDNIRQSVIDAIVAQIDTQTIQDNIDTTAIENNITQNLLSQIGDSVKQAVLAELDTDIKSAVAERVYADMINEQEIIKIDEGAITQALKDSTDIVTGYNYTTIGELATWLESARYFDTYDLEGEVKTKQEIADLLGITYTVETILGLNLNIAKTMSEDEAFMTSIKTYLENWIVENIVPTLSENDPLTQAVANKVGNLPFISSLILDNIDYTEVSNAIIADINSSPSTHSVTTSVATMLAENETFKNSIVPTNLEQNLATTLSTNIVFAQMVANDISYENIATYLNYEPISTNLASNTTFISNVANSLSYPSLVTEIIPSLDYEAINTNLINSSTFLTGVADNTNLHNAVAPLLGSNTEFKNAVISEVKTDLESNTTFLDNLGNNTNLRNGVAPILRDSTEFREALETQLEGNTTFTQNVANAIDLNSLANLLSVDVSAIESAVQANIASDTVFVTAVGDAIVLNEDFRTLVGNTVIANIPTISVEQVAEQLSTNTTLQDNLANNTTLRDDLQTRLRDDNTFYTNVASDTTLANNISTNSQLSSSVANNTDLRNAVRDLLKNDADFRSEILSALVDIESNFVDDIKAHIKAELLSDTTFMTNIAQKINMNLIVKNLENQEIVTITGEWKQSPLGDTIYYDFDEGAIQGFEYVVEIDLGGN